MPYATTHDARTIRYPDPLIKANDTVQVDIATGKIKDFIKFDSGMLMMFYFLLIGYRRNIFITYLGILLKFCLLRVRVPTQHGKHSKMTVHVKTWKNHGIL